MKIYGYHNISYRVRLLIYGGAFHHPSPGKYTSVFKSVSTKRSLFTSFKTRACCWTCYITEPQTLSQTFQASKGKSASWKDRHPTSFDIWKKSPPPKNLYLRPPEVVLFWLSRLFQVRSLNLQHCHSFSRSRPCFCVSKSNALNNAEAMNGVCFGRDVASHSSCGMKSHIARNIVAVYSRMCLLMNYHVHLARWLTMDYISSLM